MALTEIELQLLRSMDVVGAESHDGFRKCDIVLRHALKAADKYSAAAEAALCVDSDEDADVKEFYDRLRQLCQISYPQPQLAEGHGDLTGPAGPRYTECRITAKGLKALLAAEDRGMAPSPRRGSR